MKRQFGAVGRQVPSGSMTTVPPSREPSHATHRFVCTGCHIRYTSVRTCPLCGGRVVPLAELPEVPDTSMRPPQPRAHEISAVLAAIGVAGAIVLAWGTVTMWGVVPCAVVTVGLLVAPIARWDRPDAGDHLAAFMRRAPSDGHGLQDGAAREMTASWSARRPVGCAGILFGVLVPLVAVRWDQLQTIAAAVCAIAAFVLAWTRRVRRESEASAGRGVPL